MDKLRKYQKIAFAVFLLLALALVLPLALNLTVDEILTYSPPYPLLAAAAIIALYSLKAFVCFIPITALYISAGIMFSPFWALLITYVGLTCEIAIGYSIGRFMGNDRVVAFAGKSEKAAKFLGLINKHSNIVIFTSCLIPGPLPFDITNWLFGTTGIGFLRYLTYSLLGISAAMIPWVLGGNNITNPLSSEFLTPFFICLAISAALLVIMHIIEKKLSAVQKDEV